MTIGSSAQSRLAYITHPACRRHEIVEGHQECPDRIRVIEEMLEFEGLLEKMIKVTPYPAELNQIARVHSTQYIRWLEENKPTPGEYAPLGLDTSMNAYTWDAALVAAGSGIIAVDKIMAGEIDRAFCNVRPPGHHAERSKAMGFCFFDNVAVAAAHAIHEYGLNRVAIIDFDVHHGNGTEDIFKDEPRVLFCSTFQHPLYPGSGADTVSSHIVNLPMAAMTDGAAYRRTFAQHIVPALANFHPEMIFFSAGFDAHKNDPLGSMRLVEDDYRWITRAVLNATQSSTDGKAVSMLEGGYDLSALASSAAEHVRALLV